MLFNYVFIFRVVKSRNEDYKVGTEWVCFFGWRTHTVFNPSKQFDNLPQIPGQYVCVCVCVCVCVNFNTIVLNVLHIFIFSLLKLRFC